METSDQVPLIDIDHLHESPFNPRRTFREAGLQELAADIRAQGILSPLLVRPRVPLLFAGHDDPNAIAGYELVFGHRRLRAARLAGLAKVPCMVRAMTDQEVKRAQISENLEREDVHPIEEAEGFQALMRDHGVTADQLVEQTGKSRSYIYGRLTLLKGCREIRNACLAGEIGSEVMLLIARLRTDKLQQRALARIKSKYISMGDGGAKSFRAIRELLRDEFTLDLKGDCIFDTEDAALLPNAGACTTCPKRSGNAPEFQDLVKEDSRAWGRKASAELCTDPDCYAAKKTAHLRAAAAQLQAKGKTVVDGARARAAIGADGRVKGAYVALKDVKDELAKARLAAQRDPKVVPPLVVTIQDPRTGKTVEAIKEADLVACGTRKASPKAAKASNSREESNRKYQEEVKRKQAKADAATAMHRVILDRVRAAVHAAPRDEVDLQLVAAAAVRGVPHADVPLLAALWGCEERDELIERIPGLAADDVTKLLLDCALVPGVTVLPYELDSKPEVLFATAKRHGVSLDPNAQTPALATPTPSTAARGGDGARSAADTAATPSTAAPAAKGAKGAAVRYRCPLTGSTWTGRGLKPAWVRAALEAGTTLADLSVDQIQTGEAGCAGNEQTDDAGVTAGERATAEAAS